MKRRLLLTAALALGAALHAPLYAQPAAPNPNPNPNSAPPAEGRTYTPGAFDSIEIGGAAEVRYTQGDEDKVFVEGSPGQLSGVVVDTRGRLLRVRYEGGWKFWDPSRLQVQITSRALARVAILGNADFLAPAPVRTPALAVQISGAGLARFEQLQADQLMFTISGKGEGQIAGQVREMLVQISGKGDFAGENLQARRARVLISGIGDVKVWAVDDLNIVVAGVGQVEYWGNPAVRERTSGPATITHRGGKGTVP